MQQPDIQATSVIPQTPTRETDPATPKSPALPPNPDPATDPSSQHIVAGWIAEAQATEDRQRREQQRLAEEQRQREQQRLEQARARFAVD